MTKAAAIRSAGVSLAVEEAGESSSTAPPLVLAHGLTATRRYVVHGSRVLERSGLRVVSYDARGHGESSPAPDRGAYEYSDLVSDLESVLDQRGLDRVVLIGASMGAATTLAFTLAHPERVAALVQVTPAHLGLPQTDPQELARWDALADGLERDGVDGFVRAYGAPPVEPRFQGLIVEAIRQRIARHEHPEAVADALRVVPRSTAFAGGEVFVRAYGAPPVEPRFQGLIVEAIRQRIARHEHPEAVADALRVVPRSTAFDGVVALEQLAVPTLIVASRDELDPQHPYEVAQVYADRIEGAELVSEDPGASPLAWRGAQLSRAITGFLERAGVTS